jgi:hydroxyacylglutathione hydrolase
MIFKYLETGPLLVNCYIVGDEKSREAIVVDPGGDADNIMQALEEDHLKCKMIVNTHAHFDHIGANKALSEKTGAGIYIHPSEKDLLGSMSSMAMHFGTEVEQSPPATGFLNDGDVITLGKDLKIDVLLTPGHSPGSITLYIKSENLAIDGDVLFQYSIGRTDFPGGSHRELINSIKTKLFPLGDNCEIYPGHGPPTTIKQEKKYNPFLQPGAEME